MRRLLTTSAERLAVIGECAVVEYRKRAMNHAACYFDRERFAVRNQGFRFRASQNGDPERGEAPCNRRAQLGIILRQNA